MRCYNQDFIERRELKKHTLELGTLKHRKPLNNGSATDRILVFSYLVHSLPFIVAAENPRYLRIEICVCVSRRSSLVSRIFVMAQFTSLSWLNVILNSAGTRKIPCENNKIMDLIVQRCHTLLCANLTVCFPF